MDHDPDPGEAGQEGAPYGLGPDAYVVWVEVPVPKGFPKVWRLPIGVTPAPETFGNAVHSEKLPDWMADNLPPAALSDPRVAGHAAAKAFRALEREGGYLLEHDPIP